MSNHANATQIAQERLASLMGQTVSTKSVKGRKSVKAQRKAAEQVVSMQHDLSKTREVFNSDVWSLPLAFATWQKQQGESCTISSYEKALDAGRADLVIAHKRYVNLRFDESILLQDDGAYRRLVRRQMAWERTDKRNLGLLGYSAEDIIQLGVVYAWSQFVERWLRATGASEEVYDLIGRALRDRRTDEQLKSDARLGERTRYVVSGVLEETTYANGQPALKIRKESMAADVRKARRFIAARRLFRMYPIYEYAAATMPSVGSVYREVHKVFREGLREFKNTLEGLTPDGIISDAVTFVARNREDLVEAGHVKQVNILDRSLVRESVESMLFERYSFDEAWVERRAVLSVIRDHIMTSKSLLPAEVNSFVALEALCNGLTLVEIRQDVFSHLTERDFGQVLRDMSDLVEQARKHDGYAILRDAFEHAPDSAEVQAVLND